MKINSEGKTEFERFDNMMKKLIQERSKRRRKHVKSWINVSV